VNDSTHCVPLNIPPHKNSRMTPIDHNMFGSFLFADDFLDLADLFFELRRIGFPLCLRLPGQDSCLTFPAIP